MTDIRRGFIGLAGMVQTALEENLFSGRVFVFRGRRGNLIKVLWWDGDGLCLLAKRLERGRFTWPQTTGRVVSLTPAQLSMLREGIDWRHPVRSSVADGGVKGRHSRGALFFTLFVFSCVFFLHAQTILAY